MQLERWAGAIVVEFKLWIVRCRPLFNLTNVPAQHAYVSESVKCARLQGLLGISTLCRNVITKLLEDEWIGSLPSTRLKLHM